MTRPSRFPSRTLAALLAAACIAPVFAIQAQTSTATAAPSAPTAPAAPPARAHPRGGPWDGMHHRDHMARELARLRTSLRLDDKQGALWDQAVGRMQPPADARERMKAHHDRLTAMLDDPNFDPKKLAAEMDREEARRTSEMKGARDAWIAVYESLDPVQRGRVREYLRGHMANGPDRFGPRGGMRGHRPECDGPPSPAPKG